MNKRQAKRQRRYCRNYCPDDICECGFCTAHCGCPIKFVHVVMTGPLLVIAAVVGPLWLFGMWCEQLVQGRRK